MTYRRRSQQYRQPSQKEVSKIFFLQYQLNELFTAEEIEDFMSVARQSVAGEFYFAREVVPQSRARAGKKRYRGTDNYIIGIGGRHSDLARYIAQKTHRQIVSAKQLPTHLTSLRPKLVERIVDTARYDIVLKTVNAMVKSGEIRYDVGLGTWHVNQSNIDAFLDDRDFRKAIKRELKRDDRSFHGRPNRDRDRGGLVQLA